MKFLMIVSTLFSLSALASDTISSEQMAKLLSSEYTAPCLTQLYELQKSYDVQVNSYGFKTVEDVAKGLKNFTIDYTIVGGGDMSVGSASITVTEEQYTPFGAPPSVKIGRVSTCQFESTIR
jgi:hypothetical protein